MAGETPGSRRTRDPPAPRLPLRRSAGEAVRTRRRSQGPLPPLARRAQRRLVRASATAAHAASPAGDRAALLGPGDAGAAGRGVRQRRLADRAVERAARRRARRLRRSTALHGRDASTPRLPRRPPPAEPDLGRPEVDADRPRRHAAPPAHRPPHRRASVGADLRRPRRRPTAPPLLRSLPGRRRLALGRGRRVAAHRRPERRSLGAQGAARTRALRRHEPVRQPLPARPRSSTRSFAYFMRT